MAFAFERFLNVRAANLPTISPDGQQVAFLSNITGVPQVWLMPTKTSAAAWPEQLTHATERVMFVAWSPNGSLVYGMDAGGNERQQLYVLSADGQHNTPLTDQPAAIHSWGCVSPNGTRVAFSSNRRHPAHFDIYLQDIATPGADNARLIYQAENQNTPRAFSLDGNSILFARANTNLDNDLYLLDITTGEARNVTAHEGEAYHGAPHFSPDGNALYLLSNAGREYLAVARLDLATSTTTWLVMDDNHEIDDLAVTDDCRHIAYTLNDEGFSRLYIAELDEGGTPGAAIEVGGLPQGVVESLGWSADSARLTFALTGARDNYNVWVYDRATNEALPVTRSSRAGIPRESLVAPRVVRFGSFDGRSIPALYYTPQNAGDAKLPVLVLVHGGPEAQERGLFNPVVQYMVGRGFAVLTPNVRGSAGYGKTYIHLDDVRLRMDSVADLKAAVEWLIAQGNADPERIAVMGGSYGGFMTLAAVTTYPDLWAAGVDIVGIANMLTFMENTGAYRRYLRVAEYGDPDTDRDFLIEISPIHKADRIICPMMVLHGANDPRVPVGEAEQIVAQLRALGRPVEYLRYEDEGHGIVKLKNRLLAYPAIGDFLDKYVARRSEQSVTSV